MSDWRVDPWSWRQDKSLLLLRGREHGDFMRPEVEVIRTGSYRDGWPDAEKARFWPTGMTLCRSPDDAIEQCLIRAGFRDPLPGPQTPWKVAHWRIVDSLERFRGIDPMILNARATLARHGELSPKFTSVLQSVMWRLKGPWAPRMFN